MPLDRLVWMFGVILLVVDSSEAIKCYKCTVYAPTREENGTKPQLCSKFEESKAFEVDCPYSTMCMKRVFKLQLVNGQQQDTITRGCANQKYTKQVFKQREWHKEYSVEEPYEEGCQQSEDGSLYCHCRGSLCNTGTTVETASYHADAMAVIFVFNLMKYLRNVEY